MKYIPRVFFQKKLNIENIIELSQTHCHHLIQVLRMKINKKILLFNGNGFEYLAKIIKKSHNKCIVKIIDMNFINRESLIWIHLLSCIPQKKKMKQIIQKSVELGVNEITPLISQNGKIKSFKENIENNIWRNVIISACEQSGRTILPKLNTSKLFINWISKYHPKSNLEKAIFLDPKSIYTFQDLPNTINRFIILIGPESGFSKNEMNILNSSKLFQSIRIGPRILRTETVPISVISILQFLYGDLK